MTDEPGPRTIRLVLDTSAISAWNRGSVAVGELLAEIDDEHGAVIVPLACLVEAAYASTEQHRLDILIGHPATFVLGDEPADWRALAAARAIVGRADLASAALQALDARVDVLTRNSTWYAGFGGAALALQIHEEPDHP